MDSRQVYRGMDIGTDKVSLQDRARVPHHGLDLVDPDQRYSAGRFAREAAGWIADIRSRGRTPILVGGTGFFLRALVRPLFDEPELDSDRREALQTLLTGWDEEKLGRAVRVLDPERAALAVEGGRQRLSRAIEVALLSGRSLSSWHQDQRGASGGVDAAKAPDIAVCLIELSRDELDRRIEERVERMRDGGLVTEVTRLLAAGFDADSPGMTGTGYREIASHLRGEMTLEDALSAMKTQTRQYARRQLTWFRHQLSESVTVIDGALSFADQVDAVSEVCFREAA